MGCIIRIPSSEIHMRIKYPNEDVEIENMLLRVVLELGDIRYLEPLRKVVYECRKAILDEN